MDFDVLVLGTGLIESIISSSLSKQGLKVGHLDNNSFYGRSYSIFDQSHAIDAKESGTMPKRCNLETSPKLVYANGSLTDLLIESKVGSYLEFKSTDAIYVLVKGSWKILPESKEDVFVNDGLSLVEKRKLMKFISATREFMDESTSFNTFAQYLESFDLGEDLVEMILYGLLLLSATKEQVYRKIKRVDCIEESYQSGMKKAKLYLSSLGRYCKSGFLAGMYGVGSELCQGFCRMSAVHGGTFLLNIDINQISKTQNGFKVHSSNDQVFTCKQLVASSDFSKFYNCSSTFDERKICRSIHIISTPLFPKSEIALFVIPPQDFCKKAVLGIQMSSSSASVPENHWVIYLFSEITRQEMESTLDFLFPVKNFIYSVVYHQTVTSIKESHDDHVHWCPSSNETIDDEMAIGIAESISSGCLGMFEHGGTWV